MGMDGADRPRGLHGAAAPVGPDALDHARYGFHRAFPQRSAKRTFYIAQALALAALAAAVALVASAWPSPTFEALHGLALAVFAAAILLRLLAAAQLKPILWRLADPARFPVYTVLCPLYREARVVPDLAAALAQIDYPTAFLDIKLIVESDDADTVAAALAASAPYIEVIVVPAAAPRTKPKALNIGLARARGEYVVVYDAEDRPHPQQLRAALAAFEDGGEALACVQAPLVIDNAGASWLARQFAAEYAIQFREILPLLTRFGLPLPLGGSSNHFRTQAVRDVGGWDPYNVTEDADLGYRLARDGHRTGVVGPPTSEEAPVSFAAWRRQRARWIKGHMQTWLVLMRDPGRTARELGFGGFASMQLLLGAGVLAALVHGPLAFIILIAALSPYDILTPTDFTLALSGYCVAIFAALSASALANNLSHARAALTMPLYWPLSTVAALIALWELFVQPHRWTKTAHGVSRRPPVAAGISQPVQG